MKKRWLFLALSICAPLLLLPLVSLPTAAAPAVVTPLPPVTRPDERAGACYSFYYDPPGSSTRPFIPLAYNAGARWDRFDFSWPTIEPSDNGWNFGPHDTLVNDLRAAGVKNIVGILLWTPDWAASTGRVGASSAPSFDQRPPGWYAPILNNPALELAPQSVTASSSPPRGLYLAWNDSGNLWGNYVYNVVSHFGDRVKTWEVWNEVEWSYFWSGSKADYAQMLKVGYQATKAACPDCRVLYAGVYYWADPSYFEGVLDILNNDPTAPANNYFFDVMSVHLYSRSDTIYSVVNAIRSRMKVYVPDHPIWLTETGVPVWGDSPYLAEYDYAATPDEAAAYVIQSYANAWAAGVERYFFFRTHDADMGEYFGLVRNDHSLRPAYVAYQAATSYLVSPTMATSSSSSTVRRVTLWGTPRGKVSVLWNLISTTVSFNYAAILPTATLVDRWGVTRTITATGGVYALSMPGATANLVSNPNDYIIGGAPYLVIEADTTPPTATVLPLPPKAPSAAVPVSWTGADGQTSVWGYDVQVRKGSGAWTDWLGLVQTQYGMTSAVYTITQQNQTYCFRARAWDRAGNRSAWPTDPQACTALDPRRTVHFRLTGVFGDADGDGVFDSSEETTLNSLSLRLTDLAGADVVTPTVGAAWEFTATLMAGDHALIVTPAGWSSFPPGWLPRRLPVTVEVGAGTQEILFQVGLPANRFALLLPFVSR